MCPRESALHGRSSVGPDQRVQVLDARRDGGARGLRGAGAAPVHGGLPVERDRLAGVVSAANGSGAGEHARCQLLVAAVDDEVGARAGRHRAGGSGCARGARRRGAGQGAHLVVMPPERAARRRRRPRRAQHRRFFSRLLAQIKPGEAEARRRCPTRDDQHRQREEPRSHVHHLRSWT